MYTFSCSAPTEYRRCNEDCAFCNNNEPVSDCPYLEVDYINDTDNDYESI